MIDGPAAHIRIPFVNSGVDCGAACGMARPSALSAGDHSLADAISDLDHRCKRASFVKDAYSVSGLKPPQRRIIRVETDCGSALAHEIARELVLFLRRPAGQQQLSVSLAKQASAMKNIQELQGWIADHMEKNLSVQALAERVAMSVRNFERVFTRETGCTPARYVAQMRVEAARRQLEDTDKSIEQIARSCGFMSADLMRRAFIRSVGITPGRYRSRLSSKSSGRS